MRLESVERIKQGSQIAVDHRGMIICGTVRYSGRTENQFATGVLISDVLDQIGKEATGYSTSDDLCAGAANLV
jgi:hypothetical protein